MWQPKKLHIKNLMSFVNQEYDFLLGVPVLIQGENKSDKGQLSNGSGKSVLQEAFYRSIIGTSIRKGIIDKDLIRNGCNDCEINLWLHNTLTNENLYIRRIIYRKKSENIYIEINGIDQKDKFATVKDGNRFLLQDILKY